MITQQQIELVRTVAKQFAAPRADIRESSGFIEIWPAFLSKVFDETDARYAQLVERWRDELADDPRSSPIDLLSPMDAQRRETLHTLALAFLLDKNQAAHGLGDKFLREFLGAIVRHRRIPGRLGRYSEDPNLDAKIRAELAGESSRTDLWIELTRGTGHGLLVIVEIKLDAPESRTQLQSYERSADGWRAAGKGTRSYCVLLAPDQREARFGSAQRWKPLSFDDVAVALRRALIRSSREKTVFARLYLTTLLRHVIRLPGSADLTSPAHKAMVLSRYLEPVFGGMDDE